MFHTSLVTVFTALVFSVIFSISWCPQGTLALDCGNNASHNAFFGRKQAYDTLLYMNPLKVEYSWLRIVETDVHYPSPTDIKGIIHYIEVLDQFTDGNGACAYITSGGIADQTVSFHIKSKRNYGIDFIIRIYGIPL